METKTREGQVLIELVLVLGVFLAVFLAAAALSQQYSISQKRWEFRNRITKGEMRDSNFKRKAEALFKQAQGE